MCHHNLVGSLGGLNLTFVVYRGRSFLSRCGVPGTCTCACTLLVPTCTYLVLCAWHFGTWGEVRCLLVPVLGGRLEVGWRWDGAGRMGGNWA